VLNPNATASVASVYGGWFNNLSINGGPVTLTDALGASWGVGQNATQCAVIQGAAGAAGTTGAYTTAEISALSVMYGSAFAGGYCSAYIAFQRTAFYIDPTSLLAGQDSAFVWVGEVLFDARGAPATTLGNPTLGAGIMHYRLLGWIKAGVWTVLPDPVLKPSGPSASWENSADIVYLFVNCLPGDFVAYNPGWTVVPLP
jgi:hypothetical protein